LEFPNEPDPGQRNPTSAELRKTAALLVREQEEANKIPEETTAADYESNLTYFDTIPPPPKAFGCLNVFPPTITTCFSEFHRQEARAAQSAARLIEPRTYHTFLCHPAQAQCVPVSFDFTPDAYRLYEDREIRRWNASKFTNPDDRHIPPSPCPSPVSDLVIKDPVTQVPLFPRGSFSKLILRYFTPRPGILDFCSLFCYF
jgi:hypothetical protein